jgi:hypothetical protein
VVVSGAGVTPTSTPSATPIFSPPTASPTPSATSPAKPSGTPTAAPTATATAIPEPPATPLAGGAIPDLDARGRILLVFALAAAGVAALLVTNRR